MTIFTNTTAAAASNNVLGKVIVTQTGNPGERSYDPAKPMVIHATFDQQWGDVPEKGNKVAICDDGEMYCLVFFNHDDVDYTNPQPCTNARRKGGVGGGSLEQAIASFGLNC